MRKLSSMKNFKNINFLNLKLCLVGECNLKELELFMRVF